MGNTERNEVCQYLISKVSEKTEIAQRSDRD